MIAGGADVSGDGVAVHAEQAGRLAGAHSLGGVGEDGGDGVGRQPGAERGRAGAFGEAVLAGATAEHAGVAGAIPGSDGEVAVPPLAVIPTLRVETAGAAQVVLVHGTPSHPEMPSAHPKHLTRPGLRTTTPLGHHLIRDPADNVKSVVGG